MFHSPDGTLRYSPRDLIAYLEGDFAAWCERMLAERGRAGSAGPAELEWATPDEDEDSALAARKGDEHEHAYLLRLREREPGLIEIARKDPAGHERTLAAMKAGARVIYQAHLVVDGWQGYPDFLFRCPGSGCRCGGYHYTPWDTKLARSAKPHFLIQLCAYAEMLERMRGFLPDEVVFVLGQGDERTFATRDFFYYYRQLKRSFLTFQSAWRAAIVPDPGLDRSWGRWEGAAEKLLAESDHLSTVAGISRGQVRRLEGDGIQSLTALAACDPGRRVERVSSAVFERLRAQADLQRRSSGRRQPLWHLRPTAAEEPRRGLAMLPPTSDGDVFFDMEGFPYAAGGLEYLFGAVTVDDITPHFHDWWAHDETGERAAFERFIDWVVARWHRDPSLHVYHYAPYETSAVKRLMGKYATREAEVDDLLRHGVFVDLYAVVKQGFIVGTPSYSLKEIERLYRPPREGEVKSGGGSVIEYQRWLDSGEPGAWQRSPTLRAIRDYNQVDCESLWGLRSWLLDRREESGIAYVPNPMAQRREKQEEPHGGPEIDTGVADRLLFRSKGSDSEQGRLDQLIGWLVEFHRREEKPMWWRMFERHDMTIEQRYDDVDCLAGLSRTNTPPGRIKNSSGLEYSFDRDQETRLRAGDRCYVAGSIETTYLIHSLDLDRGLVVIKAGPGKILPDHLCLVPDEHVDAKPIKAAIKRYAEAWEQGEAASRAVDDLLRRRPPRIVGHDGGPLIREGEDIVPRVRDLVSRLDGSTLCIQGPPGTGKTYTAAAMIADLLCRGLRVGVTANSHKVILNLMRAVVKAMGSSSVSVPLYKVGGDEAEPMVDQGIVQALESRDTASVLGIGPVLVGGTAWVFSREDVAGGFDYLFVDEAGQVSLANAVAMGHSARNLVLIGDQMQLAQPVKGIHPGDTGLSCLEYLLHGHATVPGDVGVFLGESRRMHPDLCRFVSEAVYEGRLGNIPATERHRVIRGAEPGLVQAETGIVWVPVEHDGCGQSSEEECETISVIVSELLQRTVVGGDGTERPMTLEDILIVAPFNAQVRCLREKLGAGIQIGSVDKFQGQEAAVVIVSLCASTLDEAPRGARFLLSPNRLNVAVSRAQALAIVVGSPELLDVRCRSVEEMKLVNLLCRLAQYSEQRATAA
jgi:predicted RecB family nuclease